MNKQHRITFGIGLFVSLLLFLPVQAQETDNQLQDFTPVTPENASSVVELGVLDAGKVPVMSVAFSPDSQFLLTGHPAGVINEWDLRTGESTVLTSPASDWVRAAVYSPDSTHIVSADANNIILWDAETKEQISVLEGHEGNVASLAYTPDGTILASSGWDKTIRLWDVESGEEIHALAVLANATDLAFSPDGTVLASIDGNTAGVNLWDVVSGESLEGISLEDVYYSAIAYNQDGSLLAAASRSGIYVWNTSSRELIHTLEGHEGRVARLAFSPSSPVLISAGGSAIHLWDTERMSGFSPLSSNVFAFNSLTFNASGTLFASGSQDGLIHLWGTAEGGTLPLPVPETFTPQPGHWEGGGSNISVSFDVNSDGDIINFYWRWTIGTSYCTIDLDETLDVVDDTFSFGPDVQRIEGRFRSATSLFGKSDVSQCGNMIFATTGGPPTWWVERIDD